MALLENTLRTSVSAGSKPGCSNLKPRVSLDVVDKLFRTYNQYDTRSRQTLEETVSDDDSLLWYYLDGYNKTVVFIGTVAGGLLNTIVS